MIISYIQTPTFNVLISPPQPRGYGTSARIIVEVVARQIEEKVTSMSLNGLGRSFWPLPPSMEGAQWRDIWSYGNVYESPGDVIL